MRSTEDVVTRMTCKVSKVGARSRNIGESMMVQAHSPSSISLVYISLCELTT